MSQPPEIPSGDDSAGDVTAERPQNGQASADRVSVVIPTYNESSNVLAIVDRCLESLAGMPFEVIVVDDDSPDGTWRLARETYLADDRVQVIRRVDERGLGTAVSRGLDEADGQVCAVIDADLQHPPEALPDLVEAFEPGVDLVVASRYHEAGEIEGWSRWRRLVSRGATLLAKVALPETRSLRDPLSGFFAVRRSAVEDVDLTPNGYKILLEVLTACEYDRVVEVPYAFRQRERGTSKLSADEYVNFLVHLARLRWRRTTLPASRHGHGTSSD